MADRSGPPVAGPVAMPRLYFNGKNGEHGYLSHRYEHPFGDKTYPGVVFPTMEHYLYYAMAMLFGDVDLAQAILEIPTTAMSSIAKKARDVKGFDKEIWDEKKLAIAGRGNIRKFTSPGAGDIRRALLATEGKHLVYACPDKVWGIGMYDDVADHKRLEWGENTLGIILMATRQGIPKQSMEKLLALHAESVAAIAAKDTKARGDKATGDTEDIDSNIPGARNHVEASKVTAPQTNEQPVLPPPKPAEDQFVSCFQADSKHLGSVITKREKLHPLVDIATMETLDSPTGSPLYKRARKSSMHNQSTSGKQLEARPGEGYKLRIRSGSKVEPSQQSTGGDGEGASRDQGSTQMLILKELKKLNGSIQENNRLLRPIAKKACMDLGEPFEDKYSR